jgi:hypothetical protein
MPKLVIDVYIYTTENTGLRDYRYRSTQGLGVLKPLAASKVGVSDGTGPAISARNR